MTGISDWLTQLGLQAYARHFAENDIDFALLPDLTEDDLEKIGIASLGHRRRLLRAIAARARPAEEPAPAASGPEDGAERRQITVMFCDLVGSTALSARLDPEDLRALIGAYHATCAAAVGRFDGSVAQYLGDGVLVYFGHPQAHEDDAERAVRAGLAVIESVAEMRQPERIEVRIGIATGLVVTGDIGSGAAQQQGALGETPNLAARLQALALPGAVVIDPRTRRLVGALFEYDSLGEIALKGFDAPVAAFRVLRSSGAESRFEALHERGLTPLVGREEELELLVRRWRLAKEGEGQVVLLGGEPGIGKSRLVRALRERIGTEPHTRLHYVCSAHHQNSALHPIITQLERACDLRRDDSAPARLAKLEAVLAQGSSAFAADLPFVAALLSVPLDERAKPVDFGPQKQRERTLKALVTQIEGLAARAPLFILFEDAHWSDPTTRDALDLIVDRTATLSALLVITFRPEFQPPWIGQPQVSLLSLNRLPARQRAQMIDSLTGGKRLPKELADHIIARTDGVPLFVEELTKAVLESGVLVDEGDRLRMTEAALPLAIPATLQGSLTARLDRLAPVREVAQLGATLGRRFSHELIAAVADLAPAELEAALDRLVAAELIFRRGRPPDAEYTFKHALVQDAAYASLLRNRRIQLHLRIAEAIGRDFPEIAATNPEMVARHYGEGGNIARAIEYGFKAADTAIKRSANREAANHLEQALRLVEKLDPTERAAWELRLLIALGPALMATMSSASPQVARTYARARVLAKETGRSVALFQALWGSQLAAFSRGDIAGVATLVEELHALAREQGNDELVFQAHHASWPILLSRGDLHGAQRSLEAGIPLYRRDAYRHHAATYGGHDPGVCGHGLAGLTFALLGRLDRALLEAGEALALARELSHRPSLAHAYWLANEAHYLRRDAGAVRALAGDMLALASEGGTALAVANATVLRGWAGIAGGLIEEGVADIRTGLQAWRRTGSKFHGPYRLARAADALVLAGDSDAALAVLAEAFAMAAETGEHWYDAELERLAANAHLRADGRRSREEAEQRYARALAQSWASGARLIELRAACDLARLRAEQGRRREGLDLLAPIHEAFTEGGDTPDLREAKALRDALG